VLLRSLLFVAAIVASLATQASAVDKFIVVASTMSPDGRNPKHGFGVGCLSAVGSRNLAGPQKRSW